MGWVALVVFLIGAIYLFMRFTKGMLLLSAFFVLLLGAGGFFYWYVASADDPERAAAEGVDVWVRYHAGASKDYPLRIGITNDSEYALLKTSWSIEVYRQGYSSRIARDHYSTDKIIHPDDGHAGYWSLPGSLKKSADEREYLNSLIYKITNIRCEFDTRYEFGEKPDGSAVAESSSGTRLTPIESLEDSNLTGFVFEPVKESAGSAASHVGLTLGKPIPKHLEIPDNLQEKYDDLIKYDTYIGKQTNDIYDEILASGGILPVDRFISEDAIFDHAKLLSSYNKHLTQGYNNYTELPQILQKSLAESGASEQQIDYLGLKMTIYFNQYGTPELDKLGMQESHEASIGAALLASRMDAWSVKSDGNIVFRDAVLLQKYNKLVGKLNEISSKSAAIARRLSESLDDED